MIDDQDRQQAHVTCATRVLEAHCGRNWECNFHRAASVAATHRIQCPTVDLKHEINKELAVFDRVTGDGTDHHDCQHQLPNPFGTKQSLSVIHWPANTANFDAVKAVPSHECACPQQLPQL
jgi:hypothetical protein